MNKKAITFQVIIMAILGSLGLMVTLFWVYDIAEAIEGNQAKDICKRSVQAHALLNVKGNNFNTDSIICPTQDLPIKAKTRDEKVNEQVTKAMFDCWDQFGEGRYNLFDSDGIYCVVCHKVNFEDSGRKIPGLAEYQRNHDAPGTQQTYFSYFSTSSTEDSDWLIDQLIFYDPSAISSVDTYDLDSDKEYMALFVYAKGHEKLEELATIVDDMGSSPLAPVFIAGGVVALAAGGAAAVVGSYMLAGLAGNAAVLSTGVGGIAFLKAYILGDTGPDHMAFIALREFNSDSFKEFNCEYMPVRES